MLPYLYLVPAFFGDERDHLLPPYLPGYRIFHRLPDQGLRLGLASPELNFIGLQNYIDILTGGLPVQNFEFSGC
jgi:hypothetical protein